MMQISRSVGPFHLRRVIKIHEDILVSNANKEEEERKEKKRKKNKWKKEEGKLPESLNYPQRGRAQEMHEL